MVLKAYKVCVKTVLRRVIPSEARNLALKARHLRDSSSPFGSAQGRLSGSSECHAARVFTQTLKPA